MAFRAAQIAGAVRISAILAAHGIQALKSRFPAAWRNGQGYNVDFDDDRGVWHDFVTGEGGGILDLVGKLRGCSRKEALHWLAGFAGYALPGQPWSATERQKWLNARRQQQELEAWRQRGLRLLRGWRNWFWDASRHAERWLASPAGAASFGLMKFDLAIVCVSRGERLGDRLNDAVNRLTALPVDALRRLRARLVNRRSD
jgi:hypothetical protein